MHKKLISCVVAGTLALSATPFINNVSFADERVDGLREDAAPLLDTRLRNQVDALLERLGSNPSEEEFQYIKSEVYKLLSESGYDISHTESTDGSADGENQTGTSEKAEQGADPAQPDANDSSTSGGGVPTDTADEAPESSSSDQLPEDGTNEGVDEGASEGVGTETQPPVDESDADKQPETPEVSTTPDDTTQPEQSDVSDAPSQPQEPMVPATPTAPVVPEASHNAITKLPLVSDADPYNSGALPSYDYTENLTTEKFIAVIGEQARAIAGEHNLYASVMIAQAILESASGQSTLSKAPNNNLFGIKGAWIDDAGEKHSVSLATSEDDGSGRLYPIISPFRAYPTLADSLNDYAQLLTEDNARLYQGAWKSQAKTYEDAAKHLEGRYATDTHYAEKIIALIETYHLERFDAELDWEPIDPEIDLTDLLAEVTSHLGTPYVWGGDTPEGFDCSGLVQYSYREALGIELTRTTYTQYREGRPVQFDDLHPGDLLFFNDEGDIHHVALYLSDGFYIHAPQAGEPVQIGSFEEYEPSFAKRIVETKPKSESVSAFERMQDRLKRYMKIPEVRQGLLRSLAPEERNES